MPKVINKLTFDRLKAVLDEYMNTTDDKLVEEFIGMCTPEKIHLNEITAEDAEETIKYIYDIYTVLDENDVVKTSLKASFISMVACLIINIVDETDASDMGLFTLYDIFVEQGMDEDIPAKFKMYYDMLKLHKSAA